MVNAPLMFRHREMDPLLHCQMCADLAEFVDQERPASHRSLTDSVIAVLDPATAVTWRLGDCPETGDPSGPVQMLRYSGADPWVYQQHYWKLIARSWCLWKGLDLTCTGPVRSEAVWNAQVSVAAQRWWASGMRLSTYSGEVGEALLDPQNVEMLAPITAARPQQSE